MRIAPRASLAVAAAFCMSSPSAQVINSFNNGSGFVSASVTFSDLTATPPADDFSEVATTGAFSDTTGVSGTFAWTVNAWSGFDTASFTGTPSAVAQTATGWGVTNGNANIAGSLGEALTFTFDLSGLTLGSEPLKLKSVQFGQFTDGTETFELYQFSSGSGSLVASGTTSATALDVGISDGDMFAVTAPGSAFRMLGLTLDIGVVPEPSTALLVALGLGSLLLIGRRRSP